MHNYPEAYTMDNLQNILGANDAISEKFGSESLDRLMTIAQQRADARGEQNALESDQVECLIGTDWKGFAGDEFGYDSGKLNKWAFGVLEADVSQGKNATLFSNVQVVQQDWLETGDGRLSQLETYTDDDYDGANDGEMWIPDGAAEYICIVALSSELVHGEPDAAEAM